MTDPTATLPSAHDVDAAMAAVRPHVAASRVGRLDGVLAKFENENPTGSFKVRGALAALSAARDSGAKRIVAASAGNHGAGIAYAAGVLDVRATVVVPRDCPSVKLEKMRRLGAEVVVSSHAGYDDAEADAIDMAEAEGVPFVSPFAASAVMAGNGGTVARELIEQVPDLAAVVVPVGGGGLLAGIISELERARPNVRVAAVQSEACPAFVRSLEDGTVYLRWDGEDGWAEGLEGGTGAAGVAAARRYGAEAFAVPEEAIRAAVRRIYARDGVAIEGSSAVVFAARALGMLDHLPEPCVHVVTGGNISKGRLTA